VVAAARGGAQNTPPGVRVVRDLCREDPSTRPNEVVAAQRVKFVGCRDWPYVICGAFVEYCIFPQTPYFQENPGACTVSGKTSSRLNLLDALGLSR
jgi:hypothetical protein